MAQHVCQQAQHFFVHAAQDTLVHIVKLPILAIISLVIMEQPVRPLEAHTSAFVPSFTPELIVRYVSYFHKNENLFKINRIT